MGRKEPACATVWGVSRVTMSQTETIHTAYGDVEVETVECSSCGDKLPESDAKRFYTGKVKKTRDWSHEYEVNFYPTQYRRGWVCPYCEDDPVAFPRGKLFRLISSTKALVTVALLFATVWLLF